MIREDEHIHARTISATRVALLVGMCTVCLLAPIGLVDVIVAIYWKLT